MRVETVMHGPDTEQYQGEGVKGAKVSEIAAAARRLEDLGFDGLTAPEAGHDPYLPLAIAAEHTERVALATNVAIAFPRSPRLREYIQCLKAMFDCFQNGGKPNFKGEHYEFTMCPPFFDPGPIEHPDIPIQIAAVNPYMGCLAGDLLHDDDWLHETIRGLG